MTAPFRGAAEIGSRPHLPKSRAVGLFDTLLGSARLAAVVAPAGAGKTAAVQHWLHLRRVEHRAVVVTEDGGEASVLTILASELPGLLVIDDSHLLPRSDALDRALSRAVDEGWRLALVGRDAPPAGFWRLWGRGEALLVGFEDLLLSRDEISRLASVRGFELQDPILDNVFERTNGWAALVSMMLDAYARSASGATPQHLPLVEAHQYLQIEVIDRLSVALRSICAHLAHLGTFTADLVSEALPLAAGDLDRAWRSQAMLVRVDPGAAPADVSYAFPPIVAQLLRRDDTGPSAEEVVTIHRRASLWHESRGHWDEALSHMLQASPAHAVHQLKRMMAAVEPLGRSENVLRWFRRLPDRLRMEPASLLGLALALVQAGLAHEAAQLLDQTDASAWERIDQVAELAMVRAMVNRVLFRHAAAVHEAERALAMLEDADNCSARRLAYLHVMAVEQLRDIRLWQGNIGTVRRLMTDIQKDVIRSELQLSLVHSTAITALAALDSGDMVVASEKAEVALRLAERRNFQDTHIVAEPHLVLAVVAIEHDELDTGVERLQRARTLAVAGTFPTTSRRAELRLAPSLALAGHVDDAWRVLDDLGSTARTVKDAELSARLLASTALVHFHTGELDAARTLYTRLYALKSPPDVLRIRLQLACALGADKDVETFVDAMAGAIEPVDQVVGLLARARVREFREPREAVVDLIDALRLAEQLNLWRTVVDLVGGLGRLLEQAQAKSDLVNGPSPRFVRRLATVVTASSRKASVLSEREAEIAQHLPTRKTNAQIAEELFISENTVKTHVRHIYQKLGVEQRDEAVKLLAELGLLSRDRVRDHAG